jgi:hypothetical protein
MDFWEYGWVVGADRKRGREWFPFIIGAGHPVDPMEFFSTTAVVTGARGGQGPPEPVVSSLSVRIRLGALSRPTRAVAGGIPRETLGRDRRNRLPAVYG